MKNNETESKRTQEHVVVEKRTFSVYLTSRKQCVLVEHFAFIKFEDQVPVTQSCFHLFSFIYHTQEISKRNNEKKKHVTKQKK